MQDLTARQSCLGIVAGAGPEAGMIFWRQVLNAVKRRKADKYRGDLDAPRVRIISESELGHVMALSEKRQELGEILNALLTELDANCDHIVVACHALQELAAECCPEPAVRKLVSLPDLVRGFVGEQGLDQVGIFGAPSVSADPLNSPYSGLWDVTDVESPPDPASALALISEAKKRGATDPTVLHDLQATLLRYQAQTILIACTDFSGLPLDVPGKTIVDILEIAADKVTRL